MQPNEDTTIAGKKILKEYVFFSFFSQGKFQSTVTNFLTSFDSISANKLGKPFSILDGLKPVLPSDDNISPLFYKEPGARREFTGE